MLLAAAGIAGICLALIVGGNSRQRTESVEISAVDRDALDAATDAPSSAAGAAGPVPGSMRATLLGTNAENRNHMAWLAINDAGFDCEAVRTTRLIGDDGSYWRVNCGQAEVYTLEVDEFGGLSVRPMPYGDVRPGGVDMITEGERDLTIPVPDAR